MTKKIKLKSVSGIAWCGAYRDGLLGWMAPTFVHTSPSNLSQEQKAVLKIGQRNYWPGDLYRVRITITPIKNKKGGLIVKRNPNKSLHPCPDEEIIG